MEPFALTSGGMLKHEIDLGDDVVFKVKYGGKEYELREPTVSEVSKFKEMGEAEGKDFVLNMLEKLGMPREVAQDMPMSKLKKLVDGIVNGLTEKK